MKEHYGTGHPSIRGTQDACNVTMDPEEGSLQLHVATRKDIRTRGQDILQHAYRELPGSGDQEET